MNHPTAHGQPTGLPRTIGQQQYQEYSAAWLNHLGAASGDELARCFEHPATRQRLRGLEFPISSIAEVVSAVGVQHLKTRFLLVPDDESGQLHFSLALFATDADNTPLTAYYLAEPYWEAAALVPPLQMEVANVLARRWAENWADEAAFPMSGRLFATGYGPLQGYTFGLRDFMQPLQSLATLADQRLQLLLGLHAYSQPDAQGGGRVALLGLALCLLKADGTRLNTDDPAYDVANPCPPTC